MSHGDDNLPLCSVYSSQLQTSFIWLPGKQAYPAFLLIELIFLFTLSLFLFINLKSFFFLHIRMKGIVEILFQWSVMMSVRCIFKYHTSIFLFHDDDTDRMKTGTSFFHSGRQPMHSLAIRRLYIFSNL
jgi:hypothetical protein